MSSSSPVETKSQEPHKLWEGVFTVLKIHPQKVQMHYILSKTDAGQNIGWWI